MERENNNLDRGKSALLFSKLNEMIENGLNVPLSPGKVAVNKEEFVLALRELENLVNGELKMYREFNDKKGRIINDAKKEAEDIIYEAEQSASRIRVTKKISSAGNTFNMDRLSQEDQMSLRTAGDIYAASLIYTDEMLTEVNDVISEAYDLVENQYHNMMKMLEEKSRMLAENKAELMSNLKELDRDERYEQILELGQLLSNELYAERKKARDMAKLQALREEQRLEKEKKMKEQMALYEAVKESAKQPENAPEKQSASDSKKQSEKDSDQESENQAYQEVAATEQAGKSFMSELREMSKIEKI